MRDLAKLIDQIFEEGTYDRIYIGKSSVSLRRAGTTGYTVDQMGEVDVSPSERTYDTFDYVLKQGRWEWMKSVGADFVEEQCRDWIMAGILYEHYSVTMMTDELYDSLTRDLLAKYDMLPKWFRARATVEDLKCGSASGIKYTDDEHKEARQWTIRNGHSAESKRRVVRDAEDFI